VVGQPSITCPKCRRTSHHPQDVEHRYCGWCHEFHDGDGPKIIAIWRDATRALWDEHATGTMSRRDSPDGQDQLVPSGQVRAKHGPLNEVWPATQLGLFAVQHTPRYEARWSE
jgi:hypothetical protein